MHIVRAKLKLDWGPEGADQGRVQRLIAVDFRDRNIVFEFAGYRAIKLVHDAQGHIAVG